MARGHPYVAPPASAYVRHYQQQQRGGELPYFRGSVYGQRGAGLGSFFAKVLGGIRGLISRTPQWAKDVGKMAGKQVLRTGMDIASQAAQADNAEDFKRRAKQQMKQGAGQFASKVGDRLQQQGKGIKRRRTSRKVNKPSAKKRKKRSRSSSSKKTAAAAAVKRTKADFFGPA